jgi:hypothetical protein
MKNRTLIGTAAVALLAAAFLWYQHSATSSAKSGANPENASTVAAVQTPPALANAKFTPKQSSAKLANYRSLFDKSWNYWQLANGMLADAKTGNPDAQFYLARSIEYCNEKNGFFFEHRGQKLTLGEGLQYAAKRNLPIEIAQEVYDKCHDFTVNDQSVLGDSADWLAKATASGQPLAQAATAAKILKQNSEEMFAKASGVPNPNPSAKIGAGANPTELLRSAAESDEPEVFFTIGEMLPLLSAPNTDTKVDRLAWMLLACERGFDCTANADWVKLRCGSTPVCASATESSDIVRSFSGDNWPAVQQRASDMSAKIAAGQWDQLGIGSQLAQNGPS